MTHARTGAVHDDDRQLVAWYRARLGLAQDVLAGMVGRTTDWLGKVENGRANLERLSVIKSLGRRARREGRRPARRAFGDGLDVRREHAHVDPAA
jgi:DNA-binding XRE family transcriptional regulator